MFRIQLLVGNAVDIVQIHQIVAQRGKPCRVIRTRQFPCQLQVRQCRLQIGEGEENLPHELVQLPLTFGRKQPLLLHRTKLTERTFRMLCHELRTHSIKSMFKRSLHVLPMLPRLHDSSPPSHEYSVPDP